MLAFAFLAGCPGADPLFEAGGGVLCARSKGSALACDQINTLFLDAVPAPDERLTSLAAGYGAACGIDVDGTGVCWGHSDHSMEIPGRKWTQVTMGPEHGCGIRSDGEVECWGADYGGETRPPADVLRWVEARVHYTCGLRLDGSVACWGPTEVDGSTLPPDGWRFETISGQGGTHCGLDTSGSLACWGRPRDDLNVPPPGADYRQVSVGGMHVCALDSGGRPLCWGNDDYDQVSGAPSATVFRSLAAGYWFTCGLRDDGVSVECWGRVDEGHAEFRLSEMGG